jgi:signal transduction histidine kinase
MGMVTGNLLVVDDTPANLRLLSGMLSEQGYKVRSVISGAMALTAAQAAPPDLILLDINMPEINGYEVCQRLKADPKTADIPVIFISALGETDDKVRAFAAGGVDYITKPFHLAEVLARVQSHIALRTMQKQLQQANMTLERQVQELDAFAHTVAHDLKNPLTALIGFSDLLEKRGERMTEERRTETVQMLAQNARKMSNIVDELLLLASVRGMDGVMLEPLEMGGVIREAQSRLVYLIEEKGAEIVFPESWPQAWGYAPWVEEVWVNYLSNAVKYGGLPPRVELGATDWGGQWVQFWVRDNGTGIAAEDQARLFTPFERLHQVRAQGHGLGLSIVHRIVERLGGQVGVESRVGGGSQFSFTLPTGRAGE